MKRLFLTMMIALVGISAFGQRNYYAEAEQAFRSGDYTKAKELYNTAYVISGIDTRGKQAMCTSCQSYKDLAQGYLASGDITSAKLSYQCLLEKNPNDPVAINYITNTAQQQNNEIVYYQQPASNNSWESSCYVVSLGGGRYLAVQNQEGPASSYENAYSQAAASRVGGFSDWKLPTESQMRAIAGNGNCPFAGEFWCNTGAYNSSRNTTYGQWWKHKKDANGCEYSQKVEYNHTVYSTYNRSTRTLTDDYYRSSRTPNGLGTPKPNYINKERYLIVREYSK